MDLQNKIALVTGASRGIGRAIAGDLAAAGMKVCATARPSGDLDDLAEALGSEHLVVPCDVRDPAEVAALYEALDARFGGLDVLINNAGIAVGQPLTETSWATWRNVLATNLDAIFLLTQPAVVRMQARGGGHIVHIASDAAIKGIPGMTAYCASKHGLLGFGRALREELRGSGIRVTTLLPGPVNTTILGGAANRWDLLQPADLAAAVRYVLTQPLRAEVWELLLEPGG